MGMKVEVRWEERGRIERKKGVEKRDGKWREEERRERME